MQVLLEKEAWALFKTKVGNSIDSPELHDIANVVCKECGGLPVAILAIGATLKDKKKYVWEDVLDQFKDSMLKNIAGIDPKVYASLKLSYDRNECILCCFFPEDANISIEVLARHCIARSLLGQNTNTLRIASRRVLIVVDILKDACLLLEGKDENFVKMHDVIRDVALSIAKDDGKEILVKHGVKEWPEKDTCKSSSAISLRFDDTLELPDDLLCPQLHTLTILWKFNIHYPFLNVPDRFFRGMEKLTILELNRIYMLPPLSLANLVNLRMLRLDDCKLGDIAILKDLNNNLEILSLRGSNIKVLPSEIGQLTRLRLLDLGNCYQLTEIPQGVISNLSRLEELYISDDFTRGNKERSKDFCYENLIRFKIFVGKADGFSGTYSKSCKLAGVSLMDKFIVLLIRAEELHLEKIEGLQEVLHDKGGEGSFMERHGLNPSGFFNNLIELTIRDCRLKYLFSVSCAKGFPRLQRLEIRECEMMEAIVGIEEEKDEDELPSQVINFSQLKFLLLVNLPKLISFYPKVEKMSTSEGNSSTQTQFLFNEKVSFPRLETLILNNCVNSREIHPWNVQASKISLKFLDKVNLNKLIVRNCSEVAEVFQLEGLNVGEGQHVRPLIEVRMMELDALPQLTCLWNKDPHGILGLQILQYLTIKKCSLLRNLFTCSTAMALQQLKVLYLESCPMMEEVIAVTEDGLKEVIDDVIEFPKLEWLILKDLPNLSSFCNVKYNFNLPSLQTVVLKRCPNMHNFTFGQVRMSQIFVRTRGNDGLQIEDLNKYLKERLLLKGEVDFLFQLDL
ncbi:putative disease resistance protein [Camellia lanceoleosa]|uniref:Disease resistance protein n=1 Tax=Camellia lanceoleosa TaxID=1840588 RepID=A0ACC0H9Y2_9ERIC|nr:putative disease resistance protein [Camellia lanceoleosa]